MLNFTDAAKEKLNEIIKGQDSNVNGLRVRFQDVDKLDFSLCELDKLEPEVEPLRDKATNFFVEFEGFLFIVDPAGQKELGDGFVNYESGGILSGTFEFKKPLERPELKSDPSNPLFPKVQEFLDSEINPGLAMHGGRAELLNVAENKVYLKFGGGCQGCGMVDVTVKQGIESRLKEVFPQISGIVDATDHAGGTNPYYR